jgi:hypothetical protein
MSLRITDPSDHYGTVLLLDPETRMKEAMSQSSVVGEKQYPGRVSIESSDREDTSIGRHAVYHRSASLRVFCRGDDPFGLVEEPVLQRLGSHGDAIHQDDLGLRIDRLSELGHPTVNGHAALPDEILA